MAWNGNTTETKTDIAKFISFRFKFFRFRSVSFFRNFFVSVFVSVNGVKIFLLTDISVSVNVNHTVWRAHREAERPMNAVTEFRCVPWCADWGKPVLTYAVSWTSVRPACRRCAAPPTDNAVLSAASTRVIVLALDERSLRRCSVLAARAVPNSTF